MELTFTSAARTFASVSSTVKLYPPLQVLQHYYVAYMTQRLSIYALEFRLGRRDSAFAV